MDDKRARFSQFAKHGDFEDIAIGNEYVFALKSDGKIYSFPFSEVKNKKAAGVQEWKDLLPEGEYEGLYADERQKQLYVLCKSCDDEKGERKSGYILSVSGNGNLQQSGSFSINEDQIKNLSKKGKISFRPSGIALNPRTEEWYLISSVNKMLVITNRKWQVKEIYMLNPKHFLQPEGIAFDRANNLYISNEGDEFKNGNVLKFRLNRG
jgi:hypothetical protein